MQLYVDIIRETMKSKDMQEHLIQNIQQLSRYEWADMICSVPIALERKAELLKTLSEQTEEDETKEFYRHTAKRIRDWLCKIYNKNVGLRQNKNVGKPTFLFCILGHIDTLLLEVFQYENQFTRRVNHHGQFRG